MAVSQKDAELRNNLCEENEQFKTRLAQAKVEYLVQALDKYSNRWFNQGFPHASIAVAQKRLADLRTAYTKRTFRLVQITKLVEVIG